MLGFTMCEVPRRGPESVFLIIGSSILRKSGYINQTHIRVLYRLQCGATLLCGSEYAAFPVSVASRSSVNKDTEQNELNTCLEYFHCSVVACLNNCRDMFKVNKQACKYMAPFPLEPEPHG